MKVFRYLLVPALLALPTGPVFSQDAAPPPPEQATPAAVDVAPGLAPDPALAAEPAPTTDLEPAAAPDDQGEPAEPPAVMANAPAAIPALTVVSIEIGADLGSKLSKTGDRFPIRLYAPIVVDGSEVIPAGATGMGEVVHAKKSGGSGAAGELVLAARYLDVDGRRLRLRSLKLVPKSTSNVDAVHALNIASSAAPVPIALVGFLITGGQAVVPQGTQAQAKTAETFSLAGISAAPASDIPPEEPAAAAQPEAAAPLSGIADAALPPHPLDPVPTQPAEATQITKPEEGRE